MIENGASPAVRLPDDVNAGGAVPLHDGAAAFAETERATSHDTFPSIYVNKKHIGGNSDFQELEKSGKLAALVAEFKP